MNLAPGAVRLPFAHLSSRVPWHDTDWTGRVCAAPAANHACTILRNVKGKKDADTEEADAGRPWPELARDRVPPCVFERGGFMRPHDFTIERDHAYAGGWTKSHAHFAPTLHRMPAYSLEATPYRWVMREEALPRASDWGIAYDQALEDEADKYIETSKPTTWVQDHRNQAALLDSFFSSLVPGRSLVFVYAKDVALLEERPPGTRVLVGVGFVDELGPRQEWEYSGEGPLRSIMWERAIVHSIRPDRQNGFLLPYQELLATPALAEDDLLRFIAHAPPEHFDEFSYVSERVSHDAAIAALFELTRVVDLLPGIVDGPWETVAAWLSDRLADAWRLRGPYPGLGAALAAAGLERGGLIAHRIVESLDDTNMDPWPALQGAMADAASDRGVIADLVGRMARKAWDVVTADDEKIALLKLLARFPLTAAQARRMFDPAERDATGGPVTTRHLLENPYLIYELDRGRRDAISLYSIDRGLFPRDAGARAVLDADPLPDPVAEAGDDRRVKAACIELLEQACAEGHTLLDEPRLRRRLAAMKLEPICDPNSTIFEIAANGFEPALRQVELAEARGMGWQLQRLTRAADLIMEDVDKRVRAGPIDVSWDWRARIDEAIAEPLDPSDRDEELARQEKAKALEAIARSRIAALVGPAGTGKTTMLRALCGEPEVAHRGVLLVAPTGKARVQLADKVGARALTLAQYLRGTGRWDDEFGYRMQPEAPKEAGFATVIVDEASMLTEEMLAALIDSLQGVDRLVLCGDHRQLPPIGAGRPFADLVAHLRALAESGSDTGGRLAELKIGRRQKALGASITGRDDLSVASLFSMDGAAPAGDEALARVLSGKGDGTIEIRTWEDEDDLHVQIVEYLESELDPPIPVGDSNALKRSLGADGEYNGRAAFVFGRGGLGAEHWQLLSPVRARPGGVDGLNRLIRRTWRRGDASAAVKSYSLPPPLGADEVLFHDKVMCAINHPREAWQVSGRSSTKADVANGEIGMVVSWIKRDGVKVEFSTQPGLQFTFWTSELNSEKERGSELLELAYAITVHKAQGSQFGLTLVVIPNPCLLLSPELIYTALTRQRDRVVVFFQGSPTDLLQLAAPSRSETARRLTRLFRLPDPFETSEGDLLDGSHVHRTANGEMVRSKSEVIVANILHSLGVPYAYELELVAPDGSRRSPDFTIQRTGKRPIYWEHLGMLNSAGYRADWDARRTWYASQGILPWTEGGGAGGVLIWSTEATEGPGIDSVSIGQLASEVLALE